MSAHTQNLLADGRASLCVTEAAFRGAADARVTLLGTVRKVGCLPAGARGSGDAEQDGQDPVRIARRAAAPRARGPRPWRPGRGRLRRGRPRPRRWEQRDSVMGSRTIELEEG